MVQDSARTKQRRPSVSPLNGVPTPDGFEKYPERRHNGAWKKEDTPRFKLEQMMKLTLDDLQEIAKNPGKPMFERQIAKWIIKGDWNVIERQINQVYGQPKQRVETVDTTPHGIKLTILRPKDELHDETKK